MGYAQCSKLNIRIMILKHFPKSTPVHLQYNYSTNYQDKKN